MSRCVAHPGPSRNGASFALVVGHTELNPEDQSYAVVDLIKV